MFEAVQLLMWKHAGETGGEVPTTSQGCVFFLPSWWWLWWVCFHLVVMALMIVHQQPINSNPQMEGISRLRIYLM